jgi:predicted secreted protein
MRRLAILAALVAAACASPPSGTTTGAPAADHRVLPAAPTPTSADLDNAADGTRVRLSRGQEIKVMLDAQALAGFQWRVPKGYEPVLSQIGERIFLSKGIDPRYLGGGGMNVFRYRAEQSGTVPLTFEYGPFDQAAPPTKTVRYIVTVE